MSGSFFKVAKNLKAAMNLMGQSLEEAGRKVKAGSSAVKDNVNALTENEKIIQMADRAVIMIDQLKGSEKAVELAKNVTDALHEGSEVAAKKLKKCMDEAAKELKVDSDKVFKKYKESVKPELDDLKKQADELAAKMKDPTARKQFLDEIQATVSRESINVVKNVKKVIEDGKKKFDK